ncbi:MAG TPA: homocysteine S-methyltransferase family protein, partial [Baekduia sp.]|nr:homocysteine S-methyltransferase family protein [Baekduia sp.]
LMCHDMENIPLGLRNLRAAFDGPIGAYPHPPKNAPDMEAEVKLFAEAGREWIDGGAQIIGGCCVTTPDHIAALAPVVKEHQAA